MTAQPQKSMDTDTATAKPVIAWGVATRALPGQRVSGDLPEPLADRPAVERLECENLQDQEVQSALNEVGRFAHGSVLGYRDQV